MHVFVPQQYALLHAIITTIMMIIILEAILFAE